MFFMDYEIRERVRLLNCIEPIMAYEIRYRGVIVYVESCPERAKEFVKNRLNLKSNEQEQEED